MLRLESRSSFVGKAGELKKHVDNNWKEHSVDLAPVANEVLWKNPDFYLPKLEVGKSTCLGLFAKSSFETKPSNLQEGHFVGEGWDGHGRSVILDRALIVDSEGRPPYRDINLKGIGFLKIDKREGKFDIGVSAGLGKKRDVGSYNWEGLLHKDTAEKDCKMNGEFLSAGIRVPISLAIIGLREIFFDGKKYSVEEIRNKEIDGKVVIDEKLVPVIEVRAFGTGFRLGDFDDAADRDTKTARLMIDDAKKLVSEEMGRRGEDEMSYEKYFGWFGRTLGENVGLMRGRGWYHGYLNYHNITLDCRIADFDSVVEAYNEALFDIDSYNAEISLKNMCLSYRKLGGSNLEKIVLDEFNDGCINALTFGKSLNPVRYQTAPDFASL